MLIMNEDNSPARVSSERVRMGSNMTGKRFEAVVFEAEDDPAKHIEWLRSCVFPRLRSKPEQESVIGAREHERKMRYKLATETSSLEAALNHKLAEYAALGIHPRKVSVYRPGDPVAGGVAFSSFCFDIEAFGPDD